MHPAALADKIANLRDLGGMEVAAGRRIAPRRLVRSSTFAGLSPDAVDALVHDLGDAVCFDLRTDPEVHRDGGLEALVKRGWTWHRVPTDDSAVGHASSDPRTLIDAVPRYLDAAATVTAHLDGARPNVVTCSLGKDRTGFIVAILLQALGAARHAVVADFVLSNTRIALQVQLLPLRWRDGQRKVAQVRQEDCELVLERARAVAGSGSWTLDGDRLAGLVDVPREGA